jgi:hypothetical protein
MVGTIKALVLAVALAVAGVTAHAIEKVTVGNTKTVVRTVTGSIEGDLRRLKMRDDIYHNELITTGKGSATEIKFLDETTLTLGPNAEMTLDRFVFDPDPKKSAFVMTAAKGAFRFVSGKLPKKSYIIHTPSATIGIRGTILTIVALPLASLGRNGGFVVNITVESGEAEVTNCDGQRVVLDRPGMSTTISGVLGGPCSTPTSPSIQPARFATHVGVLDALRKGLPDRKNR